MKILGPRSLTHLLQFEYTKKIPQKKGFITFM